MWLELEEEILAEFGDIRHSFDDMMALGFTIITTGTKPKREAKPVPARSSTLGRPVSYHLTIPQKVFELYSSGSSLRETAKKCGIGVIVVRTILKKLGVQCRAAKRMKKK